MRVTPDFPHKHSVPLITFLICSVSRSSLAADHTCSFGKTKIFDKKPLGSTMSKERLPFLVMLHLHKHENG